MRPSPANRKPDYFDMKGFLDAQVAELSRQQPAVEKQVQLRDGRTETTRVSNVDWAKELQIFYQADINKPALRGAYAASGAAPYSNAAGKAQETYVLKPDMEATVKSLQVDLLGGALTDQVEEIAAVVRQDNALFYSEKKLRLRCRQGQITDYEATGVQKLVLFDSVRYVMRVRVLR